MIGLLLRILETSAEVLFLLSQKRKEREREEIRTKATSLLKAISPIGRYYEIVKVSLFGKVFFGSDVANTETNRSTVMFVCAKQKNHFPLFFFRLDGFYLHLVL